MSLDSIVTVAVSIVGFLLLLGPLIFVHELGHFLVAKWMDIRVVRFSLGFPPKAFGVRIGETEYCVSWLPWGGYVKMGGDTPGEPTDDPRSYLAKPPWKRLPVVLAGVVMNFLAAWGISSFWGWNGVTRPTTEPIVRVEETSVGYAAGLRTGDRVLSVAGTSVSNYIQLRTAAMEHALRDASKEIPLKVQRGAETLAIAYKASLRQRENVYDFGFDEHLPAVIGQVTHGFPAYQAGLKVGDRVVSVDGKAVRWFSDLSGSVRGRIGEKVKFEIERAGQTTTLELTPVAQMAFGDRRGMIGISPSYPLTQEDSLPLPQAFVRGLVATVDGVRGTFGVLAGLVTREQDLTTTLGGPISIAVIAGEAIRSGWQQIAEKLAGLSIALAVLNILPLAPLDGGHVFLLLIETVRRKPVPLKIQAAIQNAGVILVLLFMLVIVFSDVHKLVNRVFFPQIG